MNHIIKNTIIPLAFLLFCNFSAIAEPLVSPHPGSCPYAGNQDEKTWGVQLGGGVFITKPMLQGRFYNKLNDNWEFFILHNNNIPFAPFSELANSLWLDIIAGGKYYISYEENFKPYIDAGIGGAFSLGLIGINSVGAINPAFIAGIGFDYMFNDNFGIYLDVNTGSPIWFGANVGIRF